MTIRELKPAEIPSIWPLIRVLNPGMEKARFTRSLKTMIPNGYRVVAAFEGKEMLGCSGFWVRTRFWCGKQLDIDNFIVLEAARGRKIGQQLVAWLEAKALKEKCQLMVLDTYLNSTNAQAFYVKQGFALTGYHLTRMPGSNDPGKLPFKSSSN